MKSAKQTKCYREIQKEGPMNTSQLLELLNKSSRLNSTSHEISQMLTRSPLFEKIGSEAVADLGGRNYQVSVWDILPLEEVARKWLSVKHHIRKRSSLPMILRNEIERLEGEL